MDSLDNNIDKKPAWQEGLQVFLRLSAWIAFPVLVGVFVGRWLDRKYDSEPWLFLTSVGAAFLVSMFGLVTNAIKEFKKIEAESKKKK
mgnify:CR=1 FL=1